MKWRENSEEPRETEEPERTWRSTWQGLNKAKSTISVRINWHMNFPWSRYPIYVDALWAKWFVRFYSRRSCSIDYNCCSMIFICCCCRCCCCCSSTNVVCSILAKNESVKEKKGCEYWKCCHEWKVYRLMWRMFLTRRTNCSRYMKCSSWKSQSTERLKNWMRSTSKESVYKTFERILRENPPAIDFPLLSHILGQIQGCLSKPAHVDQGA